MGLVTVGRSMIDLVLPLIVTACGLWLWRDSLRAREVAIDACRRACRGDGVQLLDDTVALTAIRPSLRGGRPRALRVYAFEFSRRGTDRAPGSITLLGTRVLALHLTPAPEEPLAAPLAERSFAPEDAPIDPVRRLH